MSSIPGTSTAWYADKLQLLVFLPVSDNNGVDLTDEREQVIRDIQRITGGSTQFGMSKGEWLNDNTGQVHFDFVVPVISTFPATETRIADELRDSIRNWCDLLRQHSLFATLTPIWDISQASSAALATYESVTK